MTNWVSAAWIARLLDEHFAALSLFASQWTDSAEDCVQEAILELTRQPAPPENVAGWLFHVVRKRAVSAYRSASRRRRHEAIAARLIRVSSDQRETKFDAEELALALDQLNDDEREVVVARTWGELGFAEIALMLDISTATAFRRYEAGLKELRKQLETRCKTIKPPNCPTN